MYFVASKNYVFCCIKKPYYPIISKEFHSKEFIIVLIIGQKLINFHQKIFKYHSHREQFQLPSIWIIMEVKLYDTKIEMHMSFYPKNTSGTKKKQ